MQYHLALFLNAKNLLPYDLLKNHTQQVSEETVLRFTPQAAETLFQLTDPERLQKQQRLVGSKSKDLLPLITKAHMPSWFQVA